MRLSFSILMGMFSSFALGSPMIQKLDRAELNWTTMKIRFYGESNFVKEAFVDSEKMAIQDGLSYIFKQLPKIRKDSFKSENLDGDHDQAALDLTKRTYPIQTNIDGKGALRVDLESSLVTALKPLVEHSNLEEYANAAQPEHSGIVIKINGDFIPKPVYKLVNEKGNLLYSHKDVAEAAFEKNFMGRYLKGYSKREVASFLGGNTLELDASIDGEGNLMVNDTVWDEVLRTDASLVRDAKILLVL